MNGWTDLWMDGGMDEWMEDGGHIKFYPLGGAVEAVYGPAL